MKIESIMKYKYSENISKLLYQNTKKKTIGIFYVNK